MTDREKVIKGLECCGATMNCNECPYDSEMGGCFRNLKADALKLLKEQEPVPPRKAKRYIEYSDTAVTFPDTYDCGKCGEELPNNAKYCPGCGRTVKWDDDINMP